MAARSAAVAGIEPVDPAAMIGVAGRSRCSRAGLGQQHALAAQRAGHAAALGHEAGPGLGGDGQEVAA